MECCEEVGFDVGWKGGREVKMEVVEEGLLEEWSEGRTASEINEGSEADAERIG